MTFYQNTPLQFKCKGDGLELLEANLPSPHLYQRQNEAVYIVAWLIDGYFHTNKGIEFLNDMIARLTLSLNIIERQKDVKAIDHAPIKLKALQNAVSLPHDLKKRIETSNRYQDAIFWAIKLQAEKLIRTSDGWFDYDQLESWALYHFEADKERSTIRSKCRSVWHWYEKRDFTIPEGRTFTMSRQEAGRETARKKAEKTKAKVIGAVESMKFLGEKITASGVARYAGVDRKTASKYLIELGVKK